MQSLNTYANLTASAPVYSHNIGAYPCLILELPPQVTLNCLAVDNRDPISGYKYACQGAISRRFNTAVHFTVSDCPAVRNAIEFNDAICVGQDTRKSRKDWNGSTYIIKE